MMNVHGARQALDVYSLGPGTALAPQGGAVFKSVSEPRSVRTIPELGNLYSQALHLTLARHELESLRDTVCPATLSADAPPLAVVKSVWAEVVEALTGPTRADVFDVLNRYIQSVEQPTAGGLQRLEVLQTIRYVLQGNSALQAQIKSACARLRAIAAWQETEKSVSDPFMLSLTCMVDSRNALIREVHRLRAEIRATRNNLVGDLMVGHDENLQAFLDTLSMYWAGLAHSGVQTGGDIRTDIDSVMRTIPLSPLQGDAAGMLFSALGDSMIDYALRNLKKAELDAAKLLNSLVEMTHCEVQYREKIAFARHELVTKALQDNQTELCSLLASIFPQDPNAQASGRVAQVLQGVLSAWLEGPSGACYAGQVDALFQLDALGKMIDRLGAQSSAPFPAEVLLKVKWGLMSPENAEIIDSIKESLYRRAEIARQGQRFKDDLVILTALKACASKDICCKAFTRDDVGIFTEFLMESLAFQTPLAQPVFETEERTLFGRIGEALRQSSDPATVIRQWRGRVSKNAETWGGKENVVDFLKGVAQATALTRAVVATFGEEVDSITTTRSRTGPIENSNCVQSITKAFRNWKHGGVADPGATLYDEIQATLDWYVKLMKGFA